MKKLVSMLMLTAMLCGATFIFTGCKTSRENVLKICTWEAYTDKKFVQKNFGYTNPETGKKMKVQFEIFNTNEELYENLMTNKVDYDLICPSDYMVEKLLQGDMLLKLDKNIISGYETELEPDILKKVEGFDPNKEYAFPYAWGTFGIMYNTAIKGVAVTDPADMVSLNALWNLKPDGKTEAAYKNKIYMKFSVRDAFAAANIYMRADDIKAAVGGDWANPNYKSTEYQTLLNSLFAEPDQATIDAIGQTLVDQKKVFFDYEDENGKESMAKNKAEAYLGLFWSCDAGYAMQKNKTQTIRYSIPREGANFYVDSFVIPKYAKNVTAAQHFLKFLMSKETAYANTMASGASGTVISANKTIREELENSNEGFLKNAPADFRKNYIDSVMFPDSDTLDRCAIMRAFSDAGTANVTNKFMYVKSA